MVIGYFIYQDHDGPSWGNSSWYKDDDADWSTADCRLNTICYSPSECVWIVPGTWED